MMNWTCKLNGDLNHRLSDVIFRPESSAIDVGAATVGQRLKFQCSGEPVIDFHGDWQVNFLSKNEKQTDKKVESKPPPLVQNLNFIDETHLELEVISHQVGHIAPQMQIEKADKKILLNGISFEVISILDKHDITLTQANLQSEAAQAQQPQPYPFLGPMSLNYPLLLWIGLSTVFLIIGIWLLKKLSKHLRLKRWQEELEERQLASTPEKFFYKELRFVNRKQSASEEAYEKLQDAYYTFLEHKFKYPVRESGLRESLSYIEKKYGIEKTVGLGLRKNLVELKNLNQKKQTLEWKDIEKMGETLRKTVDLLSKNSPTKINGGKSL